MKRKLSGRRLLIGTALAVVVAILTCWGLYVLMNSRTYQVAGRIVARVETTEKVVALTLDDGPTERTPQILQALADAGIPATFYLIGSELAAHPEQGAAIARAGHEIGNHTYNHRRMVLVGPATVRDEVERTDAEIAETGYRGPITFRPPNGKKLFALPRYLSDHDRTTVMWDVEPDSGKSATADEIVAETLARVRPGSIILLHAMYPAGDPSLAAIPRIAAGLRAEGYRFVTVSRLLADK
ncbi:polysaccharide deacetylase family protein [Nocardia huaxiensis]|uniref:Polysaccharide deacetylase family protein n=1 Tax=Nocardia huaxiensis TaxID=2755382 RepID=A0A7D6V6A2_9NOCA|nr:polysaccharide deacetylase family protein [Nocardia huaxiensis]QLY27654.1 polysaccharide deacetylase family protein [Nocardia huaxiensis]